MASSDAASKVYAEVLSVEGLGLPLWYPDLSRNLPAEYVAKGVSIGDVGIITGAGAFEFCFNVHDKGQLPAPYRAPEGFQPWEPQGISDHRMSAPGDVIKGGLVTQTSVEGNILVDL